MSIFYSPFRVSNELCLQAGLNITNTPQLVNNIPSEFAHCMFFFFFSVDGVLFPHSRVPEWLTAQRHPRRSLRPIFMSPHPSAVLRTAPSCNPHLPHKQLSSTATWNPRPPPRHPYLDYTSTITGAPGIRQTRWPLGKSLIVVKRFLLEVLERAIEGGL